MPHCTFKELYDKLSLFKGDLAATLNALMDVKAVAMLDNGGWYLTMGYRTIVGDASLFHNNAVDKVVKRLGGNQAVADICGRGISQVSRWRQRAEVFGLEDACQIADATGMSSEDKWRLLNSLRSPVKKT